MYVPSDYSTRYLDSIGRDESRVSFIRTLYKSSRIRSLQMISPSIPTSTYVRGLSLQSTSTSLPSLPVLPRESTKLRPRLIDICELYRTTTVRTDNFELSTPEGALPASSCSIIYTYRLLAVTPVFDGLTYYS